MNDLLWRSLFSLSRGERQLGNSTQHLLLLRRVLAAAAGLNCALTRLWRHGTQGVDRILHGLTPLGRQGPDPRINAARFGFLVRGQMLPDFHSVQDPLLPFRREAIEPLQALLQLLLT